uniref:Uncharacterized protein n=1 Tax=viral metagenome TaxID=1070528 RepID=A0A6M3ILX4_9ZZZZ
MNKKDVKRAYLVIATGFAILAMVVMVNVVKSYGGDAPKIVVEGNYIEAGGSVGELSFGAVGAQLVEDYVPAIMYNSGYNSELPINLSGSDGDFTISSLGTFTLSGTNTINGTTTILASYDGFIIQPTPTYATGSVSMLYTNGTGKTIMCNVGAFMANSLNANLGRNFKVSMGTSTAVTGAGINVLSTTTVATTSDTILTMTYTKPFMLANNESIIGYFADVDANASSTYFSSTYWELRAEIPCTLMGN